MRITHDVSKPMTGKHLLIVEDIIDTGLTMKFLLENLRRAAPGARCKVCTLLEKPARAKTKVPIDYKGFVIEDRSWSATASTTAEKYRNLPFIGVMRPAESRPGQALPDRQRAHGVGVEGAAARPAASAAPSALPRARRVGTSSPPARRDRRTAQRTSVADAPSPGARWPAAAGVAAFASG